jgi:transcriptional regulator with XRE-family HTH domain
MISFNGNVVREKRTELGYTSKDIENISQQMALSDNGCTISKSYLEELERGDKTNPSFQKLVTISKILNINMNEFIC